MASAHTRGAAHLLLPHLNTVSVVKDSQKTLSMEIKRHTTEDENSEGDCNRPGKWLLRGHVTNPQ